MTVISIVYHSLRDRTHRQAEAVGRGARAVPGVTVHMIRLDQSQIGAGGRWQDKAVLEKLTASDGIIFGSVTFFGTVSAPFKSFLDATFGLWHEHAWKDKFAGGFTNSSAYNGDKQVTLMTLLTFAAQMGMMWVPMGDHPGGNWSGGSQNDINRLGSFLGPMAQSDADADIEASPPASDLATAERYGERFALIVRHWMREGNYVPVRERDKAAVAALKKLGVSAADVF